MMGFPEGYATGKTGVILHPGDWMNESVMPNKKILRKDLPEGAPLIAEALGNAILPQIPAFIAYAYLYRFFV